MVTASSRPCQDGAFLSDVAVGALPDMVTLTTPDGTRVLTTPSVATVPPKSVSGIIEPLHCQVFLDSCGL